MSAASDSRWTLVPAAALWLAFVGSAAGQPQFTDENFEQWVFQRGGSVRNAASARKELDQSLLLNIQEIDHVCKLTEAQKKKLQLAGRGDIKRFYDHYEVVKQKFQLLKKKEQDGNNWQELWQELWRDINPLQMTFQSGLFHEDSLLHKSLRHTLTTEQLPRYLAQDEERRRFHHRASIELAVNSFEQAMPLRDSQRQELIALLLKELKPPRKTSRNEVYIVNVRMSLLPDDKLKPVFDRTEWKMVRAQLDNYKGMVQWLKQSGQWPEDDEDAPPADAKK